MGCCASSPSSTKQAYAAAAQNDKKLAFPVWTSQGWSREELVAKRSEFWETQPAYGGSPEIWSVIKTACEASDMRTALVFLEAAEVKPAAADFTKFYDSRGYLYELPPYAICDPTDLASGPAR